MEIMDNTLESRNCFEKKYGNGGVPVISPDNPFYNFIPHVSYELIPINELVSDQEYQRNLSMKHVIEASEHFDLYQINPVKVSRRNGINYVFNGQHTMEIIAMVSGSRETPVWCMVYDDLQYKNEANIFANQQKYVKPLTPYEVFVANIEAGNDRQIFIKDIVESHGIKISPLCGQNATCAVGALEYIYDHYGHEILRRTIRLAVTTWEGIQVSLTASMLKGIAKLADVYGTDMKDDLFVAKLGNVSAKEILRTAKERKGGAQGFAEAMLLEYNKKLHSPLPFEKLYRHKVKKRFSSDRVPESELEEINQESNAEEAEQLQPAVQEQTAASSWGMRQEALQSDEKIDWDLEYQNRTEDILRKPSVSLQDE